MPDGLWWVCGGCVGVCVGGWAQNYEPPLLRLRKKENTDTFLLFRPLEVLRFQVGLGVLAAESSDGPADDLRHPMHCAGQHRLHHAPPHRHDGLLDPDLSGDFLPEQE